MNFRSVNPKLDSDKVPLILINAARIAFPQQGSNSLNTISSFTVLEKDIIQSLL